MKRLNIITNPTTVNDFADMDADNFDGAWELRAERLEAKRARRFKQQAA
jgi:hypothetical protein